MTAHLYSLDIGFDRDALPRPGSDASHPIYPLQFGITQVGVDANPVAQARDLKLGGSLLFTIYDLTEEILAASDSPIQELSFRITFQRARATTTENSPTSSDDYQECLLRPGKLAPGKSTVFSPDHSEEKFQNWNVFPGEGGPLRRFPKNQLVHHKSYPPAEGVALLHEGNFYFVMDLEVKWKAGDGELFERRYATDPEMILSPNGKPPEGEDSDKN